MLSADEVKTKLESAFSPYRCAVQIAEILNEVSLKVFKDEHDNVGFMPQSAALTHLRFGDLGEYIEICRKQVRAAGYDLLS